MIKILLELEQPNYQQMAEMAADFMNNNPDAAKGFAGQLGGMSPAMLKFAFSHLSNEQINQSLIQSLNNDQSKVCSSLENGLRQAGADLSVKSASLTANDTLLFSMIAEVHDWFPLMEKLLPNLLAEEDLPERMGDQYFAGATADDYAELLRDLPIYEQTLQFFSCCTAAKDRMLRQTEEMLGQRAMPIRIRNMRFFVKKS